MNIGTVTTVHYVDDPKAKTPDPAAGITRTAIVIATEDDDAGNRVSTTALVITEAGELEVAEINPVASEGSELPEITSGYVYQPRG